MASATIERMFFMDFISFQLLTETCADTPSAYRHQQSNSLCCNGLAASDRIETFIGFSLDVQARFFNAHRFSFIRVQDTTGAPVDRHDVRFAADPTEMDVSLPVLKPGFYSVNWTTVSRTDNTGATPVGDTNVSSYLLRE